MQTARIVDRGLGPEIEGTRITVYDIMDYVRHALPVSETAEHLRLTEQQVRAALAYIEEHRAEVEAEYESLLARAEGGNPL